jgi:hypothetical protein
MWSLWSCLITLSRRDDWLKTRLTSSFSKYSSILFIHVLHLECYASH